MNRVVQFAIMIIALVGMAAAQETVPPVPPAPPAPPAPHVAPVPPVPPVPPAPPRGRSYLGVDIRNVTPERAAALNLKQARGVEVTMVDQDAPAGKAGLKEHDVILSFNGKSFENAHELRRMIRNTAPGKTVSLAIIRAGQPMTVQVELADRHKMLVMDGRHIVIPDIKVPPINIPIITTYSRRQGVVTENLTPQLGEVFGVKDGKGVLVRSVEKGSAADKAGLRAGDVIVRVGSGPVADVSDWNELLGEHDTGPVQIGVMRDKRPLTLSMTLQERSRQETYAWPNSEEFRSEMMELRRLRPQIERSMRETQERIRRELERSRREWQQEMQKQQREFEREQQEQKQPEKPL